MAAQSGLQAAHTLRAQHVRSVKRPLLRLMQQQLFNVVCCHWRRCSTSALHAPALTPLLINPALLCTAAV